MLEFSKLALKAVTPIMKRHGKTEVGQSLCFQQGESERFVKAIGSQQVKAEVV